LLRFELLLPPLFLGSAELHGLFPLLHLLARGALVKGSIYSSGKRGSPTTAGSTDTPEDAIA